VAVDATEIAQNCGRQYIFRRHDPDFRPRLIEQVVIAMANEQPAWGQARVANGEGGDSPALASSASAYHEISSVQRKIGLQSRELRRSTCRAAIAVIRQRAAGRVVDDSVRGCMRR
jgi:hypothetical protein